MLLKDALKDADADDAGAELVYQEVADKHSVERSTLSQHHRGVTRTMQEKAIAQQLLTPLEELELVTYIDQLTVQHLPPTREIIANIASTMAKRDVSDDWMSSSKA
jgi:predicted regulator of amino acid metabolism with ACT domain